MLLYVRLPRWLNVLWNETGWFGRVVVIQGVVLITILIVYWLVPWRGFLVWAFVAYGLMVLGVSYARYRQQKRRLAIIEEHRRRTEQDLRESMRLRREQ